MSETTIPEHCRDILEESIYGVLTTIRYKDGLPSSNPVSYVWDGEQVRISTLKSRVKYRNLEANPLLAFCVVSATDLTRYVELRGRATLADDPDRSFSREQFRRGMGVDPPEDLDPPDEERAIITIHAEQVSSPELYGGRFSK